MEKLRAKGALTDHSKDALAGPRDAQEPQPSREVREELGRGTVLPTRPACGSATHSVPYIFAQNIHFGEYQSNVLLEARQRLRCLTSKRSIPSGVVGVLHPLKEDFMSLGCRNRIFPHYLVS